MDRRGSSTRISMKSHLCLPRLNRGGGAPKSHRLSPMTLLERFREAVFRLMMMSALSKSNNSTTNVAASEDVNVVLTKRPCSCYNPADEYNSEAVADCIEFIKRSSVLNDQDDEDEEGRRKSDGVIVDSSTTNAEIVLPVPVM